MSGLKQRFVKILVLLLYAGQVLSAEDEFTKLDGNGFIYDTSKVDELITKIGEMNSKIDKINERLIKSEAIQANHESETSIKFIKLFEKLEVLSEKMRDLNEKPTEDVQISKLIKQQEQIQNETRFEFAGRFKELKEYENQKFSNILTQLKKFNKKFDETKSEIQQSFNAFRESSEKSANEQSSDVIERLKEFNESYIKTTNENKEKIESFYPKLNEILDLEEKQLKFLEDFNQSSNSIKSQISEYSVVYTSCTEAIQYNDHNGVYSLKGPNPEISIFRAYCLKDPKEGEPWTLISRRQRNSSHFIDFKRNWDEYRNGFGDPNFDHWLGLKYVFDFTNSSQHELWITATNEKGKTLDSYHDDFKISNEAEGFSVITLGKHSGAADMHGCSNVRFNTFDRGNTTYVSEEGYGAGFWGPCKTNFNVQLNNNGKLEIGLQSDNSRVIYIHLAIRPKKL